MARRSETSLSTPHYQTKVQAMLESSSGTQPPFTSHASPSIPQIPQATSINLQLETIGLSPAIAEQISGSYLKAAENLRNICESSLRNALRDVSAVTAEEIRTIYQVWSAAHAQQTHTWVEETLSRARKTVAKVRAAPLARNAKEKKPLFNHEYTPLLEKYFEYNAYPSAPDKAVLARKTMMAPRQIEVWFQNHRNRAKKEGKSLRKLTEDPLPLKLSLRSLERKMPFYTIPEHERKPIKKPEPPYDDKFLEGRDIARNTLFSNPITPIIFPLEQAMPTNVRDVSVANNLNPSRPSHAFPMRYPPCCDHEPFPMKIGVYRFPSPKWSRKPATPSRPHPLKIDFDEFVTDFNNKLHLRAPVLRKQHSTSQPSWHTGRVITPPSAPHPALVRLQVFPISPIPPLPIVRAPSIHLRPFLSPGPFSRPAMIVPAEILGEISTRRKVARLPRRTPQHASMVHRSDSPTLSEGSPTSSRSSSSASLSSSIGSDVPPSRRSSSSGSILSSAPATPDSSYAGLIGDTHTSSVSASYFDYGQLLPSCADEIAVESRCPNPISRAIPI